jgi:hypothetical protein
VPLTLNATAGSASANSYSDVAAADAAALYRVGSASTSWAALTNDQKIQALVTATRQIDALEGTIGFKGERATSTQALEWPRTGTAYLSTVLPPVLVSATIELALSYVSAFAVGATVDVLNPSSNGNIKEDTVGPITQVFFEPTAFDTTDVSAVLAGFPSIVQQLLASLLRIPVSSGWGTAEAIRTS